MKKNSILLFTALIISSLLLSCSNPSSSSNGGGTESIAGWYKFVSRPNNYNPETQPVQDISFFQVDETGTLVKCYKAKFEDDKTYSKIEYIYKESTNGSSTIDVLEYYKSDESEFNKNRNPGESDFDCFKRNISKNNIIFNSESETKSYLIRTDNPELKYDIKTYTYISEKK